MSRELAISNKDLLKRNTYIKVSKGPKRAHKEMIAQAFRGRRDQRI